jgi:hypothetical protein
MRILKFLMRIRDPGWRLFGSGIRSWKKVGSGILDKHPGFATLVTVPRILIKNSISVVACG